MTDEQRSIIAESKISKENLSEQETLKLKEAEALAAQIEAESFSKYDQDYEKKRSSNKYQAETLTDDQLVDLFSEMKKETMAKREKEMKKFKPEPMAPGAGEALGGLDLIDEFNDELEAMRGEDSDQGDGGLIGDATQFKVGVAQPFDMGALEEDDTPLEDIKHYTDDIKQQLKRFREQKAQEEKANQVQSVESNLTNIFANF